MGFFARRALPSDLLAPEVRSADEAARARRLERLYHLGQERAWDGREALAELRARHGQVELTLAERRALAHVFSVIVWGELAAWKVAAQLADRVDDVETRLAATSQAHDEARHFYVMRAYVDELQLDPVPLDPWARRVLEVVLGARDLPRKLAGMHLQVETFALAIFHHVRARGVDPALSALLARVERDEARHVGLGVQRLPGLLRGLGPVGRLRFTTFQLRTLCCMLAALRRLEPHLRVLGIEPRDLIRDGAQRQLGLFGELVRQAGASNLPAWADRVFDAAVELYFPAPREERWPLPRLRAAWRVLTGRAEGLSAPIRARLLAHARPGPSE